MSRFYLHQQIANGVIEDPDGTEAVDLAAAKHEAILAARQLLANAILTGVAPLGTAFQITNEAGQMLLKVPFRDALPARFISTD
ncbi:DUF6894 family protein [Sphingomonas sp. NFX23]|uniref:DUF6894 family protein n=1 Tax=Sphingomonas sp. NFX23 TaxID=2819532 RepID=UPI003CF2AC2C